MRGPAISVLAGLLIGFNAFFFIGTLWRIIRFPQTRQEVYKDLFILAYLAVQGLVVGGLW